MTISENLNVWANIGGYMEKINGPHVGTNQGWDYVLAKLYETPNNAHIDLTPEGEVVVKRDKLNFRNTNSVYGYLNRSGSDLETITRLGNTFGAEQKLDGILEGLSATAQISFDILSRASQIRERTYEAWEVATLTSVAGLDSIGFAKVPGTSNSSLDDAAEKFFSYMYNIRASVDYQRLFNDKHNIVAKLMGERHMRQQQDLLSTNYIGLAGRVAYGYSNKYFAEANFAYQGSEQFTKENRFGFFPSVSAGWIVSNEDFLKDNKSISFLKLRASAGQTGNTAYGYSANNQYLYLSTWNNDATENQIGNPNIRWETSTKYNVGIETELWNTLYIGADFFYHNNTDVVLKNIDIIPDGMMGLGGASLPPANAGETENQGWELSMAYNKQFSKDLTLSISGNVSMSKSNHNYMAELAYDETYAYAYRKQGYPINYWWGYQTDGLFNSQAEIDSWADQSALGGVPIPGDIKYLDLNGDKVIDPKDRAPIASNNEPKMVFGFRTQVNYKAFDLNLFVNGAAKRDVYLNGFGRWSNRDNFTEYMKDAWMPDNTDASFPRLGNNTTNYISSDYWVNDGAYVRLRNIELGFTIPKQISDKLNASSIRFYVNGLNLFTWDNLPNDDFDPETANSSNINYPIIKAFNLGVNVKF
jgi:TonB-linked SusC/RagA family outer membrane protein